MVEGVTIGIVVIKKGVMIEGARHDDDMVRRSR